MDTLALQLPFGLSFDEGVTASDFVTIGLLVVLEALLSAANAMVQAVLVLGLPKTQ